MNWMIGERKMQSGRAPIYRRRLFRFAERVCVAATIMAAALLAATPAAAHRPGESYVYLAVDETALSGEFHVRVDDMVKAVSLDADKDGVVSDAEVMAKADAIGAYLAARLEIIHAGVTHRVAPTGLRQFGPEEARQIVIPFAAPTLGTPPEQIEVAYPFLYDRIDPEHRPLLLQMRNYRLGLEENEAYASLTFGPGAERRFLSLVAPSATALIAEFSLHGARQVLADPFRLLLAIALLAPLGLMRQSGADGRRSPADASQALSGVVSTAILFGLAFTASVAATNIGGLDIGRRTAGYLVAAAMLLVAWDNFRPIPFLRRWTVVLVAGLLSGLGRTDYPSIVGLYAGLPEFAVPGFGLGVTAALLAAGAAIAPIVLLIQERPFYQHAVLRYGGLAVVGGGVAQFVVEGVL